MLVVVLSLQRGVIDFVHFTPEDQPGQSYDKTDKIARSPAEGYATCGYQPATMCQLTINDPMEGQDAPDLGVAHGPEEDRDCESNGGDRSDALDLVESQANGQTGHASLAEDWDAEIQSDPHPNLSIQILPSQAEEQDFSETGDLAMELNPRTRPSIQSRLQGLASAGGETERSKVPWDQLRAQRKRRMASNAESSDTGHHGERRRTDTGGRYTRDLREKLKGRMDAIQTTAIHCGNRASWRTPRAADNTSDRVPRPNDLGRTAQAVPRAPTRTPGSYPRTEPTGAGPRTCQAMTDGERVETPRTVFNFGREPVPSQPFQATREVSGETSTAILTLGHGPSSIQIPILVPGGGCNLTLGGVTVPFPMLGQAGVSPAERSVPSPPSQAGPSQAGSSQAGPSQAGSSQARPLSHEETLSRKFSRADQLQYNAACNDKTELLAAQREAAPNPFCRAERLCNIPGCDGEARNLRVHSQMHHFPWWYGPATACFVCKTQGKDLTNMRRFHSSCAPDPEDDVYKGMGQLAPALAWVDLVEWADKFDNLVTEVKQCLGVETDRELVETINFEGWVGGPLEGATFEPVVRSALRIHRVNYGGMAVDEVRSRPANSSKVLALWKVLVGALSVMTPSQRDHIRLLE